MRAAAALAVALAAAQPQPGAAGIEAARRGGVVVVCRHGITASTDDEDEATLRYDDPSTQRRLSDDGERQAEALGRALRALGVPVDEVIASPMQRARRTGELVFGRVRVDSAWHTRGEGYGGAKMRARTATLGARVAHGDRFVFSHIGTIYSVLPSVRGELEEGDCVVVRPEGGTRFAVVGVVPWRAWVTAAGR